MIDFNIHKGAPVKNGDIDLILQQVDLLFDTHPREVLGDEEFGSKYDEYLYRLNLSAEAIKQTVLSDLYSLELFDFTPSVEVYLLQGTERDIILIDINLRRDNESYNRSYKIV